MKRNKKIGCITLAVIAFIILLIGVISTDNEDSSVRVLNTDNVNTRTGPGTDFEKSKKFAQYGDKLYILKDTAGWIKYKLEKDSDWSGWVKKEFTVSINEWKNQQKEVEKRPQYEKKGEVAQKEVERKPQYEIKGEVAQKAISIPSAWNENELVRKAYSEFVKMGKRAFRNDKVKAIFIGVYTKMTDQYGNESTDRVIKLKMTKSQFLKFSWSNLEYRPIYRQMVSSCEIHWLHPGIRKNIDTKELYYKP